MISNAAADYLRILAGEQPSIVDWQDRVSAIIADWDRYFALFAILPERQEEEIRSVVSQRATVGIVSIAVPTLQEYGLG